MSVNPTTTTTTQGDNQPVVGAASPSESATMAAPAGNSDNVKTNQVINAIESDDNTDGQAPSSSNSGGSNETVAVAAATAAVVAATQRNGGPGLTLAIPKNDSFSSDEVHFRKHPRPLSHVESKSPMAMVPRPYVRAVSFQPSTSGMSSSHSEHDHNIPPPSTEKEKSKHTRRYFATVFGICYAIFLVIFAVCVFVGDAVKSQYPLGEVFAIFMLVVGFVYFIALYTDIRLHIKEAKVVWKEREKRTELFQQQLEQIQQRMQSEGGIGPLELTNGGTNIPMPEWNEAPIKPVPHRYCFQTGRHGELFYLKLGAAWFCFGLLIHSMLTISYQVIFLTDNKPHFRECASILTLVLEILFPIYSIFVLFFIFKYANVIINKGRGVARFFLMHAIGTSLAFWIYTIVRETVDAIRLKNLYKYEGEYTSFELFIKTALMNAEGEVIECPAPEMLNSIYRNFSPYLYPFVIEFCILIVGIYYMIWANISKCPKKTSVKGHDHHPHDHLMEGHHQQGGSDHNADIKSVSSDHCSVHHADHDSNYKSTLVLHADCHAASRGLFAGLALVVATIVVIILFFVAVNEDDYIETGILVNSIFELSVLVILILAVMAAYHQISQLDVNTHPMSMLDDVLLFVSVPAFFLETTFSMVPAVANGSIMNMFVIGAQLVQILIQTPFIIDGLRRCANASILRRKKPGRELITFLTIANVSLWIYYTFSVKTADTRDERYDFYGDLVWSILNHLSLPLIMFYRFHASVCLVDIWRHAYEPGGGH